MPFFDSHCHFDFADFDEDRNHVWESALAKDIKGMVVPGVEPKQWAAAQKLSRELHGCYFAVGIHPWWIKELPTDPTALDSYSVHMQSILDEDQASAQPRCIAIGEAGLDKTIDTPLGQQIALLAWHIHKANDYGLPIIIHSVRTHNEVIALCKKHKPQHGGVVHAFNGSYETAMQLINLGFYLGVGGTISYERAHKTRATFARVPLEWILLESDAPDMPLCGHQGERNSPENLPRIAELFAALREENREIIFHQLWENHQRLFKVAAAAP